MIVLLVRQIKILFRILQKATNFLFMFFFLEKFIHLLDENCYSNSQCTIATKYSFCNVTCQCIENFIKNGLICSLVNGTYPENNQGETQKEENKVEEMDYFDDKFLLINLLILMNLFILVIIIIIIKYIKKK